MKIFEVEDRTRKLGGFTVKPVLKVPGGVDEVEETRMGPAAKLQRAFDKERSKSADSRRRGEEILAKARAEWDKKQAAEKSKEQGVAEEKGTLWRVEQSESTGRYFVVKGYNKSRKVWKNKMGSGDFRSKEDAQRKVDELNQSVEEAIKIDAPQKSWSKQDVQDYLTRIKTDQKTKSDRFKPIIHGSNVKALVKDDGTTEWDLADLAQQITTPPKSILGTNAKMAKSKEEGAMTYDLTLPALSGLVVDEDTGEFVEITTCPGAGECQLYCYARKGGYVMFPNSSMSAARALNFLVNHPQEYMEMFDKEVKMAKERTDKAGIKLLVRIHDAGDFFSKEYYDLAMDVARKNPDVKFYFYTKMGDIATDPDAPDNVEKQFSPGAKIGQVKKVDIVKKRGDQVKNAFTLPKDMFRELFATDQKGKYVKDEKGRTQIKSADAWNTFKDKLASTFNIDKDSIITYDQMVKMPEGNERKWNVIVFPSGHGDLGATRKDVANQFLMFH